MCWSDSKPVRVAVFFSHHCSRRSLRSAVEVFIIPGGQLVSGEDASVVLLFLAAPPDAELLV